ncbi:hypothetical protein ML401_20260 [Bradyrhizobium sp. 62B]|nr:hypothetical protein ML401_20260 [Bradyrhizobium sp. 62B]
MKHRRRFKQTQSLEERLAAEALRLRAKAEEAAPGIERDHLLRQARQCDTGSHMNQWLTSPGLQPPK